MKTFKSGDVVTYTGQPKKTGKRITTLIIGAKYLVLKVNPNGTYIWITVNRVKRGYCADNFNG